MKTKTQNRQRTSCWQVLLGDGSGRNDGHVYAYRKTKAEAQRAAEHAENAFPWCVGASVEKIIPFWEPGFPPPTLEMLE